MPFGENRKTFKKWRDLGATDAQKTALRPIHEDLTALVPKRNFLVHGETLEGSFDGKPRQPYRVGLIRENLEHLDEFDRGDHGPNVFDLSQVRATTELCRKALAAIVDLRERIPVDGESFQQPSDDPAAWPQAAR